MANVSIEQMVGGGRVGDVRILPQPVLGCPTAVFHAADPLPYVYHMFMGSWKISQPSSNGLKVFIRKLSSTLHRPQQIKENEPSAAAGATAGTQAGAAAGAAGAAGGVAAAAKASLHPNKPPRRPILEEQIKQHITQQQKQHQHRKGLQAQQSRPQAHQQQGAGLTVAGAVQRVAAQQQQQPQAKQQQQEGTAAAAGNTLTARKLRASQAQLVRPVTVPVPNMVQGLLMEPEVPSRILSGMPTLSLLVIAAVLVTLYKRQRGACTGGLLAIARDSVRAVRSAVGLPPRSPLTRPHSRPHLSTGPNGNALLVCTAASPQPGTAAVGAAGGCSSKGSLPSVQEAVCYSSSQHAARGHGHKRSWGSAASFQL